MKERPVLFSAATVADASGVIAAGAAACVLADVAPTERSDLPMLLGVGENAVHHPLAPAALRVERPGGVIIPGLVNAHAHLDLTHVGPHAHDPEEGFVSWVDMVR